MSTLNGAGTQTDCHCIFDFSTTDGIEKLPARRLEQLEPLGIALNQGSPNIADDEIVLN
jgi:hypothetical protein